MSSRFLAAALLFLPAPQDPPPKVDFVRDVQPLFRASCVKCHGPEKPKAQFRLDSRSFAMKGGVGGKAILPGKGADSLLIKLLLATDPDERMPRKAAPLSKAQIDLLRAWIDQGAPWPDAAAGILEIIFYRFTRATGFRCPELGPGPQVSRRISLDVAGPPPL